MKNRFQPASLAVLSCIAVLPTLALAQTHLQLAETVVTATRVDQPVAELVADVSVIEREEIERIGASSVSQLLARLPGLQVVTTGEVARVYIRGADSRMTALYIDGVRVDSQDGASLLGGGAPWSLVPVEQIERIEVVRGPAGAVYGSDAMGGVVQIFTRRGRGPFSPYADVGAGSLGTYRAGGGFSGQQVGWDYAFGVSTEDNEGYNTRPDVANTPDRQGRTQNSASARLGRQLTEHQRMEVSLLESRTTSMRVPFSGGNNYSARGNLSTLAFRWDGRWSPDYSTSLRMSRSVVARQDNQPNDYRTTLDTLALENRVRLYGGTLTAVMENKQDRFLAKPTTFDPLIRGDRTQNALAMGYGRIYAAHSVQFNVRQDHDSLFGSYQTGALSYGYALSPDWRATAAVGNAFRAPTLEQIYGPYGSKTLRPETNVNQELGLSYEQSARAARVIVYRNRFQDMISSRQTLTTCSAGSFCYFNVNRAEILGVSLSARQQLGAYQLRASYDVSDPRDVATGRQLSLRARQLATLGVERTWGAGTAGLDVQAVGRRFEDANNTKQLPGYALFSLYAQRPISNQWRAVARIDNLNDTRYQLIDTKFAAPGRTVFLGLQWRPGS